MAKHHTFIFQMTSLGLGLALLLVFLFPERFGPNRPDGDDSAQASGRSSYSQAVSRASSSVVNIYTSKTLIRESHPLYTDPVFRKFFRDNSGTTAKTQTSLGSGVIVSNDGYVLTNHHVIANADQIELLMSDGRQVKARAIGADPETDIAVLKVDNEALPSIAISAADTVHVGDVVLAIGNPFGVGQTVTQGIISATGRNQLGLNTFEDFIQTDAAINPGNSGGALINSSGELVGINTAIFSRSGGSQGIGFAIPASLARNVMNQIITYGQVIRGWLGVEGGDVPAGLFINDQLTLDEGVILTRVFPGGPGDKAGLQADDILLRIDGKTVSNVRFALNRIAMTKPGVKLTIEGLRDGMPFQTIAEVSVRPTRTEETTE